MLPLTESAIRDSFVNTSRKEVADILLPLDFDQIDWDRLDYLGWQDRKQPKRSYVVAHLADGPVGVLLQRADTRPTSRPQCSWCQDITLSNDVVFFSAKRGGSAGRKGDTIGTLACANFGCSANARKRPSVAYIGFDVEAARQLQIEGLRERIVGFVADVRGTAD